MTNNLTLKTGEIEFYNGMKLLNTEGIEAGDFSLSFSEIGPVWNALG
jgi:hypothetical protein